MNKTIVIGLSVLLCLYLAFGLMGCSAQTYTLWTWSYGTEATGWCGLVGLTQEDCIEARDHYHLRGDALGAQDQDPNLEAHRPVCLPDGRGHPRSPGR